MFAANSYVLNIDILFSSGYAIKFVELCILDDSSVVCKSDFEK